MKLLPSTLSKYNRHSLYSMNHFHFSLINFFILRSHSCKILRILYLLCIKIKNFNKLVDVMSRFPSLSHRSARRLLLYLVQNKENIGNAFLKDLHTTIECTKFCDDCNGLSEMQLCDICTNKSRDKFKLCVVPHMNDIWSIERSLSYKGRYFVVNGLLSAIDGVSPNDLNLTKLVNRIKKLLQNGMNMDGQKSQSDNQQNDEQSNKQIGQRNYQPNELILCFPTTIDGHATVQYIIDEIESNIANARNKLLITVPAKGIPLGGELEYLDDATIHTAFSSRTSL